MAGVHFKLLYVLPTMKMYRNEITIQSLWRVHTKKKMDPMIIATRDYSAMKKSEFVQSDIAAAVDEI